MKDFAAITDIYLSSSRVLKTFAFLVHTITPSGCIRFPNTTSVGLLLISGLVKYDCKSFSWGRVIYIPLSKFRQWPASVLLKITEEKNNTLVKTPWKYSRLTHQNYMLPRRIIHISLLLRSSFTWNIDYLSPRAFFLFFNWGKKKNLTSGKIHFYTLW